MKYKRASIIATLICSGFTFSDSAYSQTLTFNLKMAEQQSSDYCSLHFDISNHTNLNITQVWPEFTLKYSDGTFLENISLMNLRVRPNTTISAETMHNTGCGQISSIEFSKLLASFRVDADTWRDERLDGIVEGISVTSSVEAIQAK